MMSYLKPRFQKLFLIFIVFLIVGCGGALQEVNYTNNECSPTPRVNVLIYPLGEYSFNRGIFVYLPSTENVLAEKRYAAAVYRALLKAQLFSALEWQGPYRYETLYQAQKKRAFLVMLEDFRLFSPTKVAPGRIGFSLRIFDPRKGYSLWEVVSEVDLCPTYPFDSVVDLSRGKFPKGDPAVTEDAFFRLACLTAHALKNGNLGCGRGPLCPPNLSTSKKEIRSYHASQKERDQI